MSFRYMRVLLFYDLPTTTSECMKMANNFRKNIIKEGFLPLQESVYCKLLINDTSVNLLKDRIYKIMPKEGNVMLLTVTEKQFGAMEILVGDKQHLQLDSTERLVII